MFIKISSFFPSPPSLPALPIPFLFICNSEDKTHYPAHASGSSSA